MFIIMFTIYIKFMKVLSINRHDSATLETLERSEKNMKKLFNRVLLHARGGDLRIWLDSLAQASEPGISAWRYQRAAALSGTMNKKMVARNLGLG